MHALYRLYAGYFLSPQLLWFPLVYKFRTSIITRLPSSKSLLRLINAILLCESIAYRAVKIRFESQECSPTNPKLYLSNLLYLANARCSGARFSKVAVTYQARKYLLFLPQILDTLQKGKSIGLVGWRSASIMDSAKERS